MKMNIKKMTIVSLLCLSTLVGCSSAKESSSNSVKTATSKNVETKETLEASKTPIESETPVAIESAEPSPEVDPAETNQKTAEDEITSLASLIGKTAEEVDAVLGKPANVQNLEDTKILLVRYYKVKYLDEIVKIEVVFNDNKQVVNYISFALLKANDIESSKEILVNALTKLYGESSIERFVDVAGRQNRNWQDESLTYDLKYYENNMSLDIYPSDK